MSARPEGEPPCAIRRSGRGWRDALPVGARWGAFPELGRARCGPCPTAPACRIALTVVISARPARAKRLKKLLERERMAVIAISGLHGTGKTTAARALVRKFKLRYVCAGSVFRQLARERGMTLDEFSRYAERHPGIDRMIDRRTAEAAREDGVLIDARLAGWMVKQANLKIILTAPLEERVRRIARREGRRYKEVLRETMGRERSEAKRFKRFYNIDVNDRSVFDLVLNTKRWSAQETARILELAVGPILKQRTFE